MNGFNIAIFTQKSYNTHIVRRWLTLTWQWRSLTFSVLLGILACGPVFKSAKKSSRRSQVRDSSPLFQPQLKPYLVALQIFCSSFARFLLSLLLLWKYHLWTTFFSPIDKKNTLKWVLIDMPHFQVSQGLHQKHRRRLHTPNTREKKNIQLQKDGCCALEAPKRSSQFHHSLIQVGAKILHNFLLYANLLFLCRSFKQKPNVNFCGE